MFVAFATTIIIYDCIAMTADPPFKTVSEVIRIWDGKTPAIRIIVGGLLFHLFFPHGRD